MRYRSHEIAALCPPHEQIRLKNFDQAGWSVLKPPPPLELAGRETVKQHVTTRLRPILVNDLDHEADVAVNGCDVNEFDNTRVSNKLFECMAEGFRRCDRHGTDSPDHRRSGLRENYSSR